MSNEDIIKEEKERGIKIIILVPKIVLMKY